jgi:hypothetical protein
VKRTFFHNGFTFAIFWVFVISSLTFASDESIVRVQGRVMELDLKKNIMIVNERTFVLGPNTIFYNEKGSSISADRLRTKVWVYIEGTRHDVNKKVVAQKIYLLPKYIHEKEKYLYPFIQ